MYKKPSLTVDIIIQTNSGRFPLVKRLNDPFKNCWAIPGGFVDYGEELEQAACREAKEETSLDIELKGLVGVYSKKDRDPRGHTVTVVYYAISNNDDIKAGSDAKEVTLFTKEELLSMDLAFDHNIIINDFFNDFFTN